MENKKIRLCDLNDLFDTNVIGTLYVYGDRETVGFCNPKFSEEFTTNPDSISRKALCDFIAENGDLEVVCISIARFGRCEIDCLEVGAE